MKKKLLAFILSLLTFSQPIATQEPEPEINLADSLVILMAHATLHFGLAFAHELGHACMAQLCLKSGAAVIPTKENNDGTSIEVNSLIGMIGNYPPFKSDLLNALVHASGPLAGFAASYALLKITNIIMEINKRDNFVKGIKKGFKKPLFNEDQPTGIRGVAFAHILFNGFSLIPARSEDLLEEKQHWSDGQKIKYSIANHFNKN